MLYIIFTFIIVLRAKNDFDHYTYSTVNNLHNLHGLPSDIDLLWRHILHRRHIGFVFRFRFTWVWRWVRSWPAWSQTIHDVINILSSDVINILSSDVINILSSDVTDVLFSFRFHNIFGSDCEEELTRQSMTSYIFLVVTSLMSCIASGSTTSSGQTVRRSWPDNPWRHIYS